MNEYELATELKNQGFPYKEDRLLHDGNVETPPSQSELVEALGEHLISMSLRETGKWMVKGQATINWSNMHNGLREWGYCIKENSLERALSTLWLALNRK